MESRKVIVGPFQMGFLAGFGHTVNSDDLRKELPKVDVEGLFYACLIQAGIEEFLSSGKLTLQSESQFLEKRRVPLPLGEWIKAVATVRKSLGKFLPDGYLGNEKYRMVDPLITFLADLILAIQRKSSIVQMAPLPSLADLRTVFPPELHLMFANLVSAIEPQSANLPLPTDLLPSDHIRRFQDVLNSDLFARYSIKHRQFEDGRVLNIDAIRAVETSGKNLLNENPQLLKLRRLGISLVPLSTKVVDIVFGKLPGTLADFFGQQLSSWLKEERRIVIYRFDPMVRSFMAERRALLKTSNGIASGEPTA